MSFRRMTESSTPVDRRLRGIRRMTESSTPADPVDRVDPSTPVRQLTRLRRRPARTQQERPRTKLRRMTECSRPKFAGRPEAQRPSGPEAQRPRGPEAQWPRGWRPDSGSRPGPAAA
jgi:hypothetical protein